MPPIIRTLLLLLLLALPCMAGARTLRVGPERALKQIRDAAIHARDGDIILLDGGTYAADATTWTQNDLVLWAPEERAHIVARGDGAGWIVEGRNFTAENLEFSGARAPKRAGSAIRLRAKGKVTLRNCHLHDNESGVVGDAEELLIDRCVFDRNGAGDGQSHNIHVGGLKVTIQSSYIHRAAAGHNVRIRGQTNYILANRIMDEGESAAKSGIDVPDCGRTYIIGNLIEQGPASRSYQLVSYGPESHKQPRELYIVNNTLVNNGRPDGFFIRIRKGTQARILNNIFYGPGTPWVGGDVVERRNFVLEDRNNGPRFADPRAYDFRLTSESPRELVDRGAVPGVSPGGYDLAPKLEYVYDAAGRTRPVHGALDLGAFEYVPIPRPTVDAVKPASAAPARKKVKPVPTRSGSGAKKRTTARASAPSG